MKYEAFKHFRNFKGIFVMILSGLPQNWKLRTFYIVYLFEEIREDILLNQFLWPYFLKAFCVSLLIRTEKAKTSTKSCQELDNDRLVEIKLTGGHLAEDQLWFNLFPGDQIIIWQTVEIIDWIISIPSDDNKINW